MTATKPILTIVGATGVVGQVLLSILPTREDLWGEVRLVASDRSEGRELPLFGQSTDVVPLSEERFDGSDVVIFAVPEPVAHEWIPVALSAGAVVIDNSGVAAATGAAPLVVPEINPQLVDGRRLIGSPAGSTLMLASTLHTLHQQWGLREVVASTYHAVSDAGVEGVARLYAETSELSGHPAVGQKPGDVRRFVSDLGGSPFPDPVAFNLIPWVGGPGDGRWSERELRMREELRLLLDLPKLPVAATCVRVPVVTTHSASVHLTFERRARRDEAIKILTESSNGVVVLDDPLQQEWPTPVDVVGADPIFVGRVRQPADFLHSLDLFVCCDNLRKGSALNLLQLAELVIAERPGE